MVESRTKVKLDASVIEGLVRDALAGTALRGFDELTEGYFNTAYRLELDREPWRAVLKVGPPAQAEVLTYEAGLMRAEVRAMRLVAGDQAIPAPALLHADLSLTRLPYPWFLMEYIDGDSWGVVRGSLTVRQNGAVEKQVGAITARINAVRHDSFGYLGADSGSASWPDAFGGMCRTLFADAERFGVTLPLTTTDFDRLYAAHREAFAEVVEPRLVHWDLWAGNVRISLPRGQPRVVGVIDFERALWADPLMEFIYGRMADLEQHDAGYGAALLATPAARVRRMFYNLYLGLVLVVEDGPRCYTDKSTVVWGQAQLEHALSMLTRGAVDEPGYTSL